MKLRFVKFLTSRENEIEKKEEGGRGRGPTITCSFHHPARPRPAPLPLSSPSSLHHSRPLLLLHPAHQPASPRPSLSAATCRKSNALQLSLPAVLLLPFFFIKLPKQKSVEGRTVAGAQLADPAVLPNDNRTRPARRHPCSFIQSVAAASLRF